MPTPKWKKKKQQQLQHHFRQILRILGYDTAGANFKDTPKRAADLWFDELYKVSATKKLFTVFPAVSDQLVLVKDHIHWSRCPHHLERVKLTTSIAYIPDKFHIGLSKLLRIADYYAKGFVLQEAYTTALANGMFAALKPKGVAVHVEGEHLCMQARGIKSHSSKTITTALRGVFLEQHAAREEFLYLLKR